MNVYGEIYMLGKIGENTIKIIFFPENLSGCFSFNEHSTVKRYH